MDSQQQLVHVVNAGLGPDGKQRCRRCKEAMPFGGRQGYVEGPLLACYSGSGAATMVVALAALTQPLLDSAPECIALDGTPLRIAAPRHA
jgi:hypothetical protein